MERSGTRWRLCQGRWFAVRAGSPVRPDFEKFPEVVSKESCSSPEEISKEELRSLKESGSFGIELDSLSLVYEKTKDSKDPEVQGPFPEKSHCSYSFIYIAPHVLKMLTKCGN